ncbi:MAG: helix-hairpin-helix domain-containing protein, partial [Candidatus Ranarchaeia archaeon]
IEESSPIRALYTDKGVKGLEELPGIGKAIAKKIEEILATGHLRYLENLRSVTPDIRELLAIEGIGPRKAKILYKTLCVKTVSDLKKAIRENKLDKVPLFGEKTIAKIKNAIAFYSESRMRTLLWHAKIIAQDFTETLDRHAQCVMVAGSIRRGKETVGDIDILAKAHDQESSHTIMAAFISHPYVVEIIAKGEKKSTVRLKQGIEVDLLIIPKKSFGAALLYFTGNKPFNIALRTMAIKAQLKLNEYGLFKDTKLVAAATEKKIFSALGLQYIPPELREGTEAIPFAKENNIPELVRENNILGDLHTVIDPLGNPTEIPKIVDKAIKSRWQYIAIIAPLSPGLTRRALTEGQIQKQRIFIQKLNSRYEREGVSFRLLHGGKIVLQPNKAVAVSRSLLKTFDLVVAVINYPATHVKETITKFIVRALYTPFVNIIAHPTNRIINKKEGYNLDFNELADASVHAKTYLEINCSPNRLDIRDIHVRQLLQRKNDLLLSIGSNARNVVELNQLGLGVSVARRGWATKKNILNTRDLKTLMKLLSK